jgi:hypothetical protein
MMMAYEDASDRLNAVTVSDDEAYTCLVAYNLPVLRVEQQEPNGPRCIIWCNPPTDDQQAKAMELVGTASHSW